MNSLFRFSTPIFGVLLFLLINVSDVRADLVRIGPGAFTAVAPTITFSEPGHPIGQTNPVYVFTALPSLGNVTVSFGGHFNGQTTGTLSGGVVTLVNSDPDNPLALSATAPLTRISLDGANPTSPVLSGTPTFNGPISVNFSTPVAAVGLDGGFFNAIGGTSIEAYDAQGNILGRVTNSQLGIEFFGLADSSGANVISGISFFVTGNEPAGFAIDNLRFGTVNELVTPPGAVPEPATLILLGTGLAGIAAKVRRRRRARQE